MEIEYQNKYVVTWCLDRDGPRICLRAITAENQLRTIGIISEDFNLELEDAEARDFLNILSQIAASTQFTPQKVVTPQEEPMIIDVVPQEEPVITDVVPQEEPVITAVVPQEEPVITAVVPQEEPMIIDVVPQEEPVAPEVPDSSEIIQILKESERTYAEITPSSPDDVSIEISQKTEEPVAPIFHEPEGEKIIEKIISSESHPTQEIPDVLTPEIETASFFQQSVSKSPLEMLLEEDEGEEEVGDVVDVPSISEPEVEEPHTPSSEFKTVYSPDDLPTEAFFSKFDSTRTIDLFQEPEPESEPKPSPEPKTDFERVVKLEPTPKFVKKEPVKTEPERRAEVEKERAARRRRLWELTRGF